MKNVLCCSLTFVVIAVATSFAQAEAPDFHTAQGVVEKFEKDVVTIHLGEKGKKAIELKVTGTSSFSFLVPQVRSGKTILTQRSADSKDLAAKQSIAVIYAGADKDYVLLSAVMKAAEKEKEKK